MNKILKFFLICCLCLIASVSFGAKKDLKLGFIYVSPIGDAGWSYAHDQARQKLEQMPGISTSYVEAVPEGSDAERVILNMARKGYDIIFGTSFGYMDSMYKIASKYPHIVFMHCSGFKTRPNMGTYFGRMYQARFLTGMVAGAMTKTNILGYVAAFPIPEVIRGINAFTLGARYVNPKVQVRVVWVKSWYDPATEKEAAKSLLSVGADVLTQHQDSPATQEAAQEAGVYSIGYNSDMTKFAPKSHLTAAVWNWFPIYKEIVDEVQDGKFKSKEIWYGLEKGVVGLAPFGPMVSKKIIKDVEKMKKQIIAGKFKIFKGPIADQTGKIRIPTGQVASDKELLGMDWFVQGVVGSTK